MKTCYIDVDTRAICDLSLVTRPDEALQIYEVNRVNTPETSRGKGVASRLMRERVLAEADAEGVGLQLYIQPTGGLDWTDLASWYFRLGFRFKVDTNLWVRYPMG